MNNCEPMKERIADHIFAERMAALNIYVNSSQTVIK